MKTTQAQRVKAASSERREREKQELRQAILTAAQGLFLSQGYEGLSMRQVAEQIGYTPTTIYLYFADKEDLSFAVMDQIYTHFTRDIQRAYGSTPDPVQRLRALAQAYIAFGRQYPEAYQIIFMRCPNFLLHWKADDSQPRSESLLILKQAIQDAQAAGLLKAESVDTLSEIYWAAVHGAVSLAITLPALFGQDRLEHTFAAIVEATLTGIRAP